MANDSNRVMHALRHLERRFDESGRQMSDFMAADAAGEQPDPQQFTALLEHRSVTRRAMEAQYKLHEKPLKTVLTESK
ncbi:hypothetical protein AAKU55_003584 [Oxalobacteraceae bacterium GrIS 1.11]